MSAGPGRGALAGRRVDACCVPGCRTRRFASLSAWGCLRRLRGLARASRASFSHRDTRLSRTRSPVDDVKRAEQSTCEHGTDTPDRGSHHGYRMEAVASAPPATCDAVPTHQSSARARTLATFFRQVGAARRQGGFRFRSVSRPFSPRETSCAVPAPSRTQLPASACACNAGMQASEGSRGREEAGAQARCAARTDFVAFDRLPHLGE